ncbi:phage head morphogenesis protein [Azospirillum picis]|uniref:SPP1 gp7 family putative phage head morphogenesis protein n=1 Tax=Azospirillum picis TaxID=488438 RepID=A0ABU0MNZ9_9PROT|nr:phage minor head protein [Azospirillum picis]MBP2301300.1 SPP1 gp7 family putative phage head morphogenesis protein [Azospirillum picis]MDQ0535131.1 SPP1 gp7 family putative phage head morphogenesis protein [Azospirillum picis]
MPISSLTPLPPEQAITFLEAKGYRVGFAWQDVWEAEHAVAFTVAKMMEVDLLADVHQSLVTALQDGQSFAEWRKGLEPLLQARGWWGKAIDTDPLTGEEKVVQLGSPRRLKTIFDTNVRMSMAAGQWERIERLAPARPFLRYVAVKDDRTRPEHLAWSGTVLKVGDPWWDTHSPPCGWGCRCTLQQLSAKDLERNGWTEAAAPPPLDPRPWMNSRTGETIEVPAGIDPGFAYHKGKAARTASAARQLLEKMAALPPELAATVADPKTLARQIGPEFSRWVDGLDLARPRGEMRPVGTLTPDVVHWLADNKPDMMPDSGALMVTDKGLAHLMRDAKKETQRLLPADVKALPAILAEPQAVYFDTQDPALLYVFDPPGRDDKLGKIVVRVNFATKEPGTRVSFRGNFVTTGGLLKPSDIEGHPRYSKIM